MNELNDGRALRRTQQLISPGLLASPVAQRPAEVSSSGLRSPVEGRRSPRGEPHLRHEENSSEEYFFSMSC